MPAERGWSRSQTQEPQIPCPTIFPSPARTPLSLACTLMVCITLFHSAAGYGVVESADFDGNTGSIVHVYDPFDL